MDAVPDDVRGAELAAAELVAHTESPQAVQDYLHCLAMSVATAKAAYAEARSRGLDGDDDALRAADEWLGLAQRIGTAMDTLRAIERAQHERDRRGAVIFVDQKGPDCGCGEHRGNPAPGRDDAAGPVRADTGGHAGRLAWLGVRDRVRRVVARFPVRGRGVPHRDEAGPGAVEG